MSVVRAFSQFYGGTVNMTLVGEPRKCPRCHHAIDPRFAAAVGSSVGDLHIQAAYQCPRDECRELFVGYYERESGVNSYTLVRVAPASQIPQVFPEEVVAVSPNFVTVYNQALSAEQIGLDQIAGMGFRKSVEFLIKDFAIHRNPGREDDIKKSTLGACIKTYVSDPNVQKTATRATWLGNDETHYVRRWSERDVTDLKLLIKLTVNWIENVLLTEKYESEMPA